MNGRIRLVLLKSSILFPATINSSISRLAKPDGFYRPGISIRVQFLDKTRYTFLDYTLRCDSRHSISRRVSRYRLASLGNRY